ncbi:Heat shock protein GrpE [hydrothermal vent metagenome]|uniref:Heat shock protein GrpE n=1 Tax=hydrothermal vent metagenome TaxID=652676 RepID=A0A3B1BLG6_9ZZZZ
MTDNNEDNDVNPESENPESENNENDIPENTDAGAPEGRQEDDKLVAAVTEIADLKDRLLRAVAETENLRRRADREKADAANYAMTAFARDLLSVGDNLRRALDSIPADTDLGDNAKTLVEGIEMTERELLNMLERHNIKKIDPMGEKFSHALHQALFEVPDTGKEDGTIVQVMQVGYVIKDRLLRPAMVGVAKGGASEKVERVDTKV